MEPSLLPALWPIPLGFSLILGSILRRRSVDREYRHGTARWIATIVLCIALSYAPVPGGDVTAGGFPFPIGFMWRHGTFPVLSTLGPFAIISMIGNAIFVRELWWIVSRIAHSLSRRKSGDRRP